MTPERIKEAVEKACIGFKRNEKIAFQRYFIAFFYPIYKHEAVAFMTDKCDRTSVVKTIKRIAENKYYPIRERILASLIIEGHRPLYTWDNPKGWILLRN